jgi:hypothetical protein
MSGTDLNETMKYGSRARPDLSASVTHWTRKGGNRESAFDILKCILRGKRIIASTPESGYIKAGQRATCFSETPVTVMMRLFRLAKHDRNLKNYLKWEPYGLSFLKLILYQDFKGRPVLYLSDEEYARLVKGNPQGARDAWRVVQFDQENVQESVDFTHEREWRTPGDVDFGALAGLGRPLAVVDKMSERDDLLAEFPPGDASPVRGVLCLADLRLLG